MLIEGAELPAPEAIGASSIKLMNATLRVFNPQNFCVTGAELLLKPCRIVLQVAFAFGID